MTPLRLAILGDSLTAGYGLKPSEALPVRLQVALSRLGVTATVLNAGVSGDTTADGLRRLDRDIPDGLDLCLVALGANDMMQIIPTQTIRRNLDAILVRLAARGIPVMLCGMRAPPWFGLYAVAFDGLFAEAARRHDVALDPFLLAGVALDPAYALPDRIHPNAAGIEIVADRLAPGVAAALGRQGRQG